MYKGKRFKKSSHSDKTYKAIVWVAAILKLITVVIQFFRTILG
jgi:hypothetical protein